MKFSSEGAAYMYIHLYIHFNQLHEVQLPHRLHKKQFQSVNFFAQNYDNTNTLIKKTQNKSSFV